MKIKRMTASFGGLEGARLELGPGLNVIQAPNEGGKSTWAGFLKAMLYGIDTRDRDRKGYLADKNRYQPWSGAPMEGELQLEWECQDITLRRFAAKGSPFSGFEAVYTASGDPVPGLTSANVGAAILGVGREVYLRSAFVGQGKAAVTPNGELEARIAALATSGQEDVSYSTVERTLKDWRNRRRANRSNGLLPELEEELAQAEQALQDMGRIRAQAQADQERLASLEAEQQRLKDDVALWDRIEKHDLNRRYGQALADQEAAQAALDALSPPAPEMDGWTAQEAREWAQQEQEQYQAAVDERRKLQEQRDAIQAASQKKARIAVILAAVLAAAGIVLGVLGGLGGIVYIIAGVSEWKFENGVAGFGFLALAVMIFGQWKPTRIALAALLFGFFRALGNVYSGFDLLSNLNLPSSVYNMLPYVISLVVLAFTSQKSRAPKAEGIPYDKARR